MDCPKRKYAPAATGNGLHDVVAWREFMKRHDLKSAELVGEAETALPARKLLAEVEERDLMVAIRKE